MEKLLDYYNSNKYYFNGLLKLIYKKNCKINMSIVNYQ